MTAFSTTRLLAAAGLSLLFAGCTTIPPSPQQLPGAVPAVRAYLDRISLSGRLSVRYQNNGKDEALHGSFTWDQDPRLTRVSLLTPLGQTVANIMITPDGATLTQANQPPRTAANVDTLVSDTLGWPLPIAGLRDWLQGYGVDASGKRFVATPQASSVTTQDGWQIIYAAWDGQDSPEAASHPKRIDLHRQTDQAGDVAIRLVIDTWQQ